jgi:hypothetical protein
MKGREGFIICQVICKRFLRLQDLANCRGNFSMAYYGHVSLLADVFDVGRRRPYLALRSHGGVQAQGSEPHDDSHDREL